MRIYHQGCFLHMLTCVCVQSKTWLAARVACLLWRAAHIACVPRLWQRQSFERTLLAHAIWRKDKNISGLRVFAVEIWNFCRNTCVANAINTECTCECVSLFPLFYFVQISINQCPPYLRHTSTYALLACHDTKCTAVLVLMHQHRRHRSRQPFL